MISSIHHSAFTFSNMEKSIAFYRYGKLLANKVMVHCSPQDRTTALIVYSRDPDGIILEAIEGKTRV